MFIGKVTGTIVSTQKIDAVVGRKLLLVQALNVKGEPRGELEPRSLTAVAVDTVGAGEGELVLVTQGSSARLTEATKSLPVDAVVVGIIDAIQIGDKELYKKRS